MLEKSGLIDRLLTDSVYDSYYNEGKNTIVNLFGEELAATIDFDQKNPHHCYDLFGHLLKSVDNIKASIDINNYDDKILLVAAIFHDVGKVDVAVCKDGKNVFYGHANKSAIKVGPVLKRMGFDESEIKIIQFYINHHDDFISWRFADENVNSWNQYLRPITVEEVEKYFAKNMKDYNNESWIKDKLTWVRLIKLCYADVQAQAETAIWQGKVVGTMEEKMGKLKAIESLINKVMA